METVTRNAAHSLSGSRVASVKVASKGWIEMDYRVTMSETQSAPLGFVRCVVQFCRERSARASNADYMR